MSPITTNGCLCAYFSNLDGFWSSFQLNCNHDLFHLFNRLIFHDVFVVFTTLYVGIYLPTKYVSTYLLCTLLGTMGPTMLLRATCAPLNHCFILTIFLIHLSKKYIFPNKYIFPKTFLNNIMLRCILTKSKDMSLKDIFKLCF
jgi:hypothetical protein